MKIHILCDSPRTQSGFSVVGKNLAVGLTKLGHEVSMTGFQTAFISEEYNGIEVLPINTQYIDEIGQYINNVQKSGAELVINIFNGDDAQQNIFAKIIKPTVWYVPVEGNNIPDVMINDLLEVGKSGKIIAQCDYGKYEMMSHGITSTTIYHGYDPEVFKKQDNKNITSSEKVNILKYISGKWQVDNILITSLDDHFDNKFIFGFTGANHGIRKRIERLLTAYSIFLNEVKNRKNNTLLVLRTMPISITGINLLKICADLEISANVVFLYGENNRLTDEAMNVIYNCFDVNVSASSSEGFGLPILETMACGIPQVGPKCSSFTELITDPLDKKKDRGLLADKGLWQMLQDGSYRFLVDEQNLSDKMELLYADKHLREQYGENAEEWAKQYTWEKVINQWNDLISTSEPIKE
jgi:glycosyltransferase involved in cell wall biosynthesis